VISAAQVVTQQLNQMTTLLGLTYGMAIPIPSTAEFRTVRAPGR